MHRAYSLFEIKSVDRAQRIIEGLASTPEVDRGNDALDPHGAQFTLPMPLLLEHGAPIGEVFAAQVKADGIHIRAQISRVDPAAPPDVRGPVETAWASLTATPPLMRGFSVGWKPLKFKMVDGIRKVSSWIWGETSAVVLPMNAGALITSVKSLAQHDQAAAASGHQSVVTPGVTGSSRKTAMSLNVSEQLTTEKAALQLKSTRFEQLMADEQANGGLDATETTERDTLMSEIKGHTGRVSQLQTLEAAHAMQASTIMLPAGAPAAARPKAVVEFKSADLPPGNLFTRVAMAVAAGRGSKADTVEYARKFTNTPEVLLFVKNGLYERKDALAGTAVVASPGWGGELVNPNTMLTQFIGLVMPRTIIGRVQGFDRVPFNIPFIEQTGGSTFNWVGEGGVKGVGELAFVRNTITWSKVAGIVVLTDELLRLSDPSAQDKVQADMVKQCAKFLDQQFIRVAVSSGANNPASITYGVSSPSATGVTATALRHDLNIALQTFDTLNEDEGSDPGLAIVMTPALARGISLLTTSLGLPEFPTMTPQGGTLLGYPVIVSSSVDSGTIVVFKPSEIYLASDNQVTLDASREATLDMAGGSSPTFNLWQNNCVGLRAEQWIRWQKKRTTQEVVAVIDTAAYAPA